jgi:hypothetical protein
MEHLLGGVGTFEVIRNLGLPGAMFAVCYLLIIAEDRKWKQHREQESKEAERLFLEREKERAEHIAKWDSMVKTHAEEVNRAYKLLEKQAEVIGLHATVLNIMSERINTNQFCPIIRDRQKGS